MCRFTYNMIRYGKSSEHMLNEYFKFHGATKWKWIVLWKVLAKYVQVFICVRSEFHTEGLSFHPVLYMSLVKTVGDPIRRVS